MSSMTTESATHSHGLHVVIPTSTPRVPSASTPKTSTAERVQGPNPLDTPSHSHGLFALPRPASDSPIPGHSHGLFRLPAAGPSTPTTPRMSARAARRSSLFSMYDDEPEQHDMAMAAGGAPERAQQELALLPPTSEAEEYSEEHHANLHDLKVIGDGQFHVDGNNDGGNN